VHHSDCGSLMMKNENIREYIKTTLPAAKGVDGMTFAGIVDVTQSVKDDLAVLKASPLIRKEVSDKSYGLHLDIKTGVFTPVA
jgi:carbonic anhydrase